MISPVSVYSPKIAKTNKSSEQQIHFSGAEKMSDKKSNSRSSTIIGILSIAGLVALVDYFWDKRSDAKTEKEAKQMDSEIDALFSDSNESMKDLDIKRTRKIAKGVLKNMKKHI